MSIPARPSIHLAYRDAGIDRFVRTGFDPATPDRIIGTADLLLLSTPLYDWTLPFGTVSRRWTGTGGGAWRYDDRTALLANEHFIEVMRARNKTAVVAMLQVRSRQYRVTTHDLDAQRSAAEGNWMRSVLTIAGHPSTYRLLLSRIMGRLLRVVWRQAGAEISA